MEYTSPWPHYIFENFLPPEKLSRLHEIISLNSDQFRQDEDDEMKINFKFLPDIDLAKYFLSADFKSFLQSTTGYKLNINLNSLVQLRLMTPESSHMPAHVDNQDEDSLVCILYVSKDWKHDLGGELCLLKTKENAENPDKVLEPLCNRLVIFRSQDTHWHAVNAVKNWNRYSIIMEWIIS